MATTRQLRRLSTSSSCSSRPALNVSPSPSNPPPRPSPPQRMPSDPTPKPPPKRPTVKKESSHKSKARSVVPNRAGPSSVKSTSYAYFSSSAPPSTSANPFAGLHPGWLTSPSTSTYHHPYDIPSTTASSSRSIPASQPGFDARRESVVAAIEPESPLLMDVDWLKLLATEEKETINFVAPESILRASSPPSLPAPSPPIAASPTSPLPEPISSPSTEPTPLSPEPILKSAPPQPTSSAAILETPSTPTPHPTCPSPAPIPSSSRRSTTFRPIPVRSSTSSLASSSAVLEKLDSLDVALSSPPVLLLPAAPAPPFSKTSPDHELISTAAVPQASTLASTEKTDSLNVAPSSSPLSLPPTASPSTLPTSSPNPEPISTPHLFLPSSSASTEERDPLDAAFPLSPILLLPSAPTTPLATTAASPPPLWTPILPPISTPASSLPSPPPRPSRPVELSSTVVMSAAKPVRRRSNPTPELHSSPPLKAPLPQPTLDPSFPNIILSSPEFVSRKIKDRPSPSILLAAAQLASHQVKDPILPNIILPSRKAEAHSLSRNNFSPSKPVRSNLQPLASPTTPAALPRLAFRSSPNTFSTLPDLKVNAKEQVQLLLSKSAPSSSSSVSPLIALGSASDPSLSTSLSSLESSPSSSHAAVKFVPRVQKTPLPAPPPRPPYASLFLSKELDTDSVPFFTSSNPAAAQGVRPPSSHAVPPHLDLRTSTFASSTQHSLLQPLSHDPTSPFSSSPVELPVDPELAWSRYSKLNPCDLPASTLSSLFDSQSRLTDSDFRHPRLFKLFLHISRRPVGSVLSSDQLRTAFLAMLKMGEELSVCSMDVEDEDLKREHQGKRETIAALGREIWRHFSSSGGKGKGPAESGEEKQEMLWRWIGLIASGSSEPFDPSTSPSRHRQSSARPNPYTSRLPIRYSRPNHKEDRINALCLFLDRLGTASPSILLSFARSLTAGSWQSSTAEVEIARAVETVRDVRFDRDRCLMAVKRVDANKHTLWRLRGSEASHAKRAVEMGYTKGKSAGVGFEGEKTQEWIGDLLGVKEESDVTLTMVEGKIDEEMAASLASRTTTSILLLADTVANKEPVSSHSAHLIISSLLALQSSSPQHQIPHQTVRQLVSSLLTASQDLDCVSPQHHHDLISVFLQFDDLPFTERLYKLFRIRERKHVFPLNTVQDLLRLSLGIEAGERGGREEEAGDESQLLGREHKVDGGFASNLYTDLIAWGGRSLEGPLLARFLYVVGSRPEYAGLASRALADTLASNGPDAMIPQYALSIATSVTRRVIAEMSLASSNHQGYGTPLPSSATLGVTNALEILPLLRGLLPLSSIGVGTGEGLIEAFNEVLTFVSEHPTAENRERIEREVRTMISYGPRPDGRTFEVLFRLHLGLSGARMGGWREKVFRAFEPYEPTCDVARATSCFQTMVKLNIAPSPSSYALFIPSLVRLSDPTPALDAFRHSTNVLCFPPSMAITTKLLDALLQVGRVDDANEALQSWGRVLMENAKRDKKGEDAKSRVEERIEEMQAWMHDRMYGREEEKGGGEGIRRVDGREAASAGKMSRTMTGASVGASGRRLEALTEWEEDEDDEEEIWEATQRYRTATG